MKKTPLKLFNLLILLKTRFMKNVLRLLAVAALFGSCDDGDLIVTDFNFENQQLQWCGTEDSQVVFNTNNSDVHEAIAFKFGLSTTEPQFFSTEEGEIAVPLNASNQIIYRVFDGEVKADYFCNQIPPVAPKVTEEYRSTTGGEVIISTALRTAEDHDGDGVPSSAEGMAEELDTDADGIPNYLDIDDDGDNVLTKDEIKVQADNSVNNYPDTDNDGIPNYLDADDDNDGTITRYEDWNKNNSPLDDQNEAGLAHYLNPAISDSFTIDTFRENAISRSFRYTFTVENLTLVKQNGDGEQIRLQNYVLGYYDSPSQRIVLTPTGAQ